MCLQQCLLTYWQVLEGEAKRKRRVLVFCNTMDSCRAVEHRCRERELPTVCYHGDMPPLLRKEAMHNFAGLSVQLLVSQGACQSDMVPPGSAPYVLHVANAHARRQMGLLEDCIGWQANTNKALQAAHGRG
jgi:hypothetical protein